MDLQTFEEGLLLDANDDETVLTVDIVEKRSRFFCTSYYVTLIMQNCFYSWKSIMFILSVNEVVD